jgi:hypothetical protein
MAAGSTYTPIATTTLGSATSTVTFSSIAGTYTDLVLVMNPATTHTLATFVSMLFNSDSGANYSITELYGNGTSALSASSANTPVAWLGLDVSISNVLGESVITSNMMNYANTSVYKSWLGRVNRGNSSLDYYGTNAVAGTWRNTAAITSITIKNTRGATAYDFATGSTFTLYGIQAA